MSVIGAVSVSPLAQRLGFSFATAVDGYFSAAQVLAFLRDLLRHLRGKVVVQGDGGPNHEELIIRAFLPEAKAAAAIGAVACIRSRPEPGGSSVESAQVGAIGQ